MTVRCSESEADQVGFPYPLADSDSSVKIVSVEYGCSSLGFAFARSEDRKKCEAAQWQHNELEG